MILVQVTKTSIQKLGFLLGHVRRHRQPQVAGLKHRRVPGRYQELIAWLHEGEQLATDFPGYLGSGVLAPPPGDDEFQIIFRFADEATLQAWEHSVSRKAWLLRGSDLFAHPSEHRVSGIDGWFGAAGQRPPRWKQAVAKPAISPTTPPPKAITVVRRS